MAEEREPQQLYEHTAEEGKRRLSRSFVELAATSFVAGIDVVFGVIALGVTHHLVSVRGGPELADLAGALAFGIAFVFIIVGRSELFTENFLVPIAGLDFEYLFGIRYGANVGWEDALSNFGVAAVGNVIGGVLFVTLTRFGQATSFGR
jgi:formate/nitrite transporter FocA (FNT family)